MTALSSRSIQRELGSYRFNLRRDIGLLNLSHVPFHENPAVRHAIAPDRDLEDGLMGGGRLSGFAVEPEPLPGQIQAASLELRVGDVVHYMKGDFTSLSPRDVEKYARDSKGLKSGEEIIIYPGEVCAVRSYERLRLPEDYYGISDIRSGFARVGVGGGAAVTRNGVISGEEYLREPEHVYFKIIPHAFPIILRCGQTRPVQVWFREHGSGALSSQEIEKGYGKDFGLMRHGEKIDFSHALLDENGLALTLRTSGYYVQKLGRKKAIDVMLKRGYNWEEYFEFVEDGDSLMIKPGRLYLLGSKEEIFFSPMVCGDLARSPDTIGHGLSNNFARFVNPGYRGELTMEVWSYADRNWILIDGQHLGRVSLEGLDSAPLHIYRGNFQHQKAPLLTGCFKQ